MTKKWKVEPLVVTRARDNPVEGEVVDPHAVFSIDGERYESQTMEAKVLPGVLRIYA